MYRTVGFWGFFRLLVLNYTPRTDMFPVGNYVTGLFAATANQQVWHTSDVQSQGCGCAQDGQPPAVLPEQQHLTGSLQGGHHPPAGFHRQDRVRCRALSDDKQLTHPQRCRCFQKSVLLAEVWFDPFCSQFAPECIHCWAELGLQGWDISHGLCLLTLHEG